MSADLASLPKEQPASAGQAAIAVEGLTLSYGELRAVAGISFFVRPGEIFGLLGPNGAGKTSTISMLTGLLTPSAGVMRIHGLDLGARTDEAKRLVGVVPQGLALYPNLTGRDNLAFFGRIYGVRGHKLKARMAEVLEIAGLADRANDIVETYSGGMKRRLNLAASLMHEPRVLFLDEPTVGVDPQSRNAIFEAIENMNRAGVTVVYTTHYMEEAQRLCGRVAIMDQGRIIALDTPAALCASIGGTICRATIAEGDAAALLAALQATPGIREPALHGAVMEFASEPAQQGLAALFSAASRLGVRVAAVNIDEPSLESVFLKLTGKRLRDDA